MPFEDSMTFNKTKLNMFCSIVIQASRNSEIVPSLVEQSSMILEITLGVIMVVKF